MRQFVFAIFALIFIALVGMVLVFIATVILRGAFTVAHGFTTQGVPAILRAIAADPWYIPAIIIAVLVVWSYPWEQGGQGTNYPVRRGRQVNSPSPVRYRPSARRPASSPFTRSTTQKTRTRNWTAPRASRTRAGRTGAKTRRK